MTTLEQAAREALEALTDSDLVDACGYFNPLGRFAINRANTVRLLRAALAAGQAQPVAWLCELAQEDGSVKTQIVQEDPDGLRWNDSGEPSPFRVTPLYAAPPAQPLTDEQIADACSGVLLADHPSPRTYDQAIARAIERAHGIGAKA